jgi:hypothetical protein
MNRISLILLGAVGIIALIWIGVYYNNRYSIILENPMKAVPGDAAFIIEAKRPAESLKSFFDSDFKKQLPPNSWFAYADSSIHFLDSVISETGSAYEIWKTNPLVISAHLTHASEYDFLYLTNLPRGWTERKLKNFVTSAAASEELTVREYLDVNIYELKLKDNRTLIFASDRSVAMFSFTSMLVEESLRQIKNGRAINETRAFRRIESSAKNELRIYFNYPFLRDFAAALSENSSSLFYSLAASFARWTGLKGTTDNSSLLLNGKTSSLDSTDLVNLVRIQRPQILRATSIAPSRTALLLQFGLSNAPDFFNRLNRHSLFAESDRSKTFEQLQKSLKVDLQQQFTSWMSNEMALAITEPAGSFVDNNLYAFIRTNNSSEAINRLKQVRTAAEKKIGPSKREEKYHNCLISSIPVQGIVPLMYGRMFEGINNCYFTAINDFIVFANQSSSLKDLIDEYDEGKVLERDTLFRSSIEKVSPESNIAFYFSPQHAVNITGVSFGTSFINLLGHSTNVCAQWINSAADISTRIVIDFGKKPEPLPVLLFSAQLDTTINITPAIIKDAVKRPFIFVQDAGRSLYKIDFSGNIIWKKEMTERIIGGFSIVDFYRDGRNQLLFNTDSLLHMIDINGENVGNYPIRLPARASNACSVTDFGKNIFIACSNQMIYAYQLNGKPLSDWNYYHTNTLVKKPIQSFTIDNAKYLVINEENDAVTYLDPKGNPKVSFKDKFIEAPNSMVYYVGKDSVVGNYFVSTDTAGRVIKLFTDKEGALKAENLPKKYSREHSFMSSDVNGDGKQDLVFLDNNEVTAFHDTSIIFQNKVADGLTGLYKYTIGESDKVFVTSEISNRIYMINADGSVARGFPLRGALYPAFNVINQNRNILITGSSDMTLQVYELKNR